jgi:hypothetical protein
LEKLECYLEDEDYYQGTSSQAYLLETTYESTSSPTSMEPEQIDSSGTISSEGQTHPPPQPQKVSKRENVDPWLLNIHDEAFSRFGVLLLDVDGVDHLDLASAEGRGGVRTTFKMQVPERNFGRITGLVWEEKRVHP